ncbi:MAG: GntR family transcriptional regulator [Lachnospiraceae bacterium]|nr:GntR family transcriptional regulator [Lachnospiraceae bacterium]MDY5640347.1 GntR family transcriptional regulator [Lachnospiraceae bacterium]
MSKNSLSLQTDEFLPLRDEVFNTLREKILKGVYKPGERLMEIHLADQLGVSRTPIREAIRMLELEGLVKMVPRKGAQVAKISKEDLQDVLEVRKALDTLSVKLACERITEDEIKLLNNAEREFEKALASKDVREIAEADVAFHDVIHSATKNGRLKSMISNLAERIYRYRFEYIKQQSDGGKTLMLEHREIMRCIESRDVESAVKATEIHIDNQEISISEQLDIL